MYLQKVISQKMYLKIYFLSASCRPLTKKTGTGSGAGSVSRWYRSADPDPYQNVTDPQHCVQIKQGKTYDDKN
jgi:hypothetical protein